MNPDQDDLLKPTLRPGLDVARFDRPWNPSSLVYVAFFGGVAGGGTLYAINARRLGMQDEFRRILIATIALTITTTAALAWLYENSGDTAKEGRTNARLMRVGAVFAVVLLAKWMAKRQQPGYDAYDYSDRPKGKLWPYGIAAVLLGFVVHSLLFSLTLVVIRSAKEAQ